MNLHIADYLLAACLHITDYFKNAFAYRGLSLEPRLHVGNYFLNNFVKLKILPVLKRHLIVENRFWAFLASSQKSRDINQCAHLQSLKTQLQNECM